MVEIKKKKKIKFFDYLSQETHFTRILENIIKSRERMRDKLTKRNKKHLSQT